MLFEGADGHQVPRCARVARARRHEPRQQGAREVRQAEGLVASYCLRHLEADQPGEIRLDGQAWADPQEPPIPGEPPLRDDDEYWRAGAERQHLVRRTTPSSKPTSSS